MTLAELETKSRNICGIIEEYENRLSDIEKQAKALLPKGYWYTYDIDTSWNRPKKYSVKKVSCTKFGDIIITVKEVFKKKPWPSFTGESIYYIKDFMKLNIYKTEQEAIDAHYHRICPKCGGFMMNSDKTWCVDCIKKRRLAAEQFKQSHRFYEPKRGWLYHIEYEDELTRHSNRGFNGDHFKIRRLDTGEVIETNNLWSDGGAKNIHNLPEIEFLKGGSEI